MNTPYIANGAVYVRNGKSSDPADRSDMDILMRQSMNYSDIELKGYNSEEGKFITDFEPVSKLILNSNFNDECYAKKFYQQFSRAEKTVLYIENKGRHYDENIELVLKMNKRNYFNVMNHLLSEPNEECDEIFSKLVRNPLSKDVSEFKGIKNNYFNMPEPILADGSYEYKKNYIEFLVKREYPYEIVLDGEYIYMKTTFKVVNAGQKMFLPAAILSSMYLREIEYTITSKYSFGMIKGKLIN